MEKFNSPLASTESEAKPDNPNVKLFQTSQKYLELLGISPSDQPYPLNWKISINFAIFGFVLICNALFIIREAETFWDYSESAYVFCGLVIGSSVIAFVVYRVDVIFKFIRNVENAINTSE